MRLLKGMKTRHKAKEIKMKLIDEGLIMRGFHAYSQNLFATA